MGYHLEGRLLEVCNCDVLCPCWIGEDPDDGICDTVIAWRVDKARSTASTWAGWTIAVDRACARQHPARQLRVRGLRRRPGRLRSRRRRSSGCYTASGRAGRRSRGGHRRGRLGGDGHRSSSPSPGGRGHPPGDVLDAELEPLSRRERQGLTTLTDTVFSTVPGAPVFVGKAPRYRSKNADARHRPRHQGPQRPAEHVPLRRTSGRRRRAPRHPAAAARRRPGRPARVVLARCCLARGRVVGGAGAVEREPLRASRPRRLDSTRTRSPRSAGGPRGRRRWCPQLLYAAALDADDHRDDAADDASAAGDVPPDHRRAARRGTDCGARRRSASSRCGPRSAAGAHFADAAVRAVRQLALAHSQAGSSGPACSRWPGLFQFSELKHRCLEALPRRRSAFVGARTGTGAGPGASAFRSAAPWPLCVGCCWALMLVDVRASATGNLGWMLAARRRHGRGEDLLGARLVHRPGSAFSRGPVSSRSPTADRRGLHRSVVAVVTLRRPRPVVR